MLRNYKKFAHIIQDPIDIEAVMCRINVLKRGLYTIQAKSSPYELRLSSAIAYKRSSFDIIQQQQGKR